MKLVFVGAPSSGKTTLANEVFVRLKSVGHAVEIVPEWVRTDIQKFGKMSSIWEQYRTRQHQKELEDAVPPEVEFVLCDSGTLSSYFYATLYADASEPRQRLVLQDMYRYLVDDIFLRRYDHIFFVPRTQDVKFDDGTRFQTSEEIDIIDDHMRIMFTRVFRRPNIHVLWQPFSQRLTEVMKLIGPNNAEPIQKEVEVLTSR